MKPKLEGKFRLGPHKGYRGRAEYDNEAKLFHGKVVGLRDVVTFQAATPGELLTAFKDSVDDYLSFCRERNESPDKPYSGRLLARIPVDLHKQITNAAEIDGVSLNVYIVKVLSRQFSAKGVVRKSQTGRSQKTKTRIRRSGTSPVR